MIMEVIVTQTPFEIIGRTNKVAVLQQLWQFCPENRELSLAVLGEVTELLLMDALNEAEDGKVMGDISCWVFQDDSISGDTIYVPRGWLMPSEFFGKRAGVP